MAYNDGAEKGQCFREYAHQEFARIVEWQMNQKHLADDYEAGHCIIYTAIPHSSSTISCVLLPGPSENG